MFIYHVPFIWPFSYLVILESQIVDVGVLVRDDGVLGLEVGELRRRHPERGGLFALFDLDGQRHEVTVTYFEHKPIDADRLILGCEGDERLFAVGGRTLDDIADLDQGFGIEEGIGLNQFLFGGVGERQFVHVAVIHIERLAIVGGFDAEHIQQETVPAHRDLTRVIERRDGILRHRDGELRLEGLGLEVREEGREDGKNYQEMFLELH